jgi:hypothetical protein
VVELVVDDGEQADTVLVGCDLPAHPAGRFGGEVRVVEAAVADNQAMGRVGGEDGVVAPEGGAVRGVVAKRGADLAGGVDEGAEQVPGAVFGLGERVPDLRRGGADEQVVGLRRRCGGGH